MALRALVVGGTGGIGFAMACRVAAEASSSAVIISGRTKPKNIPHPNIEFRPLDASSMRNIKQYTDAFKASQPPPEKLDLLIMTQGIMTMAGRTETPEGIDRKMALHYYGKQLLIRELLPVLKDDAQVIIVFDAVYGNPTKIVWDDLDLKKNYDLGKAANHCMVMNDAMIQHFAAEQQRQPDGTARRHFVHAWPGAVNTSLTKKLPWGVRHASQILAKVALTSPEDCAERLLNGSAETAAADSKEWKYWSCIDNKGRPVPKKTTYDEEQRGKVVQHTWQTIDNALQVPSP